MTPFEIKAYAALRMKVHPQYRIPLHLLRFLFYPDRDVVVAAVGNEIWATLTGVEVER